MPAASSTVPHEEIDRKLGLLADEAWRESFLGAFPVHESIESECARTDVDG